MSAVTRARIEAMRSSFARNARAARDRIKERQAQLAITASGIATGFLLGMADKAGHLTKLKVGPVPGSVVVGVATGGLGMLISDENIANALVGASNASLAVAGFQYGRGNETVSGYEVARARDALPPSLVGDDFDVGYEEVLDAA